MRPPQQPSATQLRLEAIDALEPHYSPRVAGGFLQHQPLGLAHAAAAGLLRLLGFTDVQRDGERLTSSTPDQTEDYILTRFADKYGRAVSFAYAGPSDHDDLASVFVDADLLQQSMNHQLVAAGLVYPTYYSKLFPDLRNALTAAANQARTDQAGVWADGATTSGATITSLEALDDQLMILVGCQKPVSGHAARSYSWIRPPRRSRRWICLAAGGPAMAWRADRSGADRSRLRWGRWRL